MASQSVNNDSTTSQQPDAQRVQLQKFNDQSLHGVEEFRYPPLPPAKKRVRLLKLKSGTTYAPEIFCELIEADYDNSFHILTHPKDDLPQPQTVQDEAEKKKQLESELKVVLENQIEYEALSWCWGKDEPEYAVQIWHGDHTYKKKVKKELALALQYLRLPNTARILWIDAICINQDNYMERNNQVQMMSRVYSRAKQVCIWLGEHKDGSEMAIKFIQSDIMDLKTFDVVGAYRSYYEKWKALMKLMQRDWFSRRWVVQEIALATKAEVYCGPDHIPWKELAVAVELFVEFESARHRRPEAIQMNENVRYEPGWFEHVSKLGASLLVQATGKVFRAHRTPMDDGPAELTEEEVLNKRISTIHTIDPLDRTGILSLEYLVSTMFTFKATEPRDAIYSMLAVARDATPFAEESGSEIKDNSLLILSVLDSFLEAKPFVVDYRRPYSEVCRDFVSFCIQRKSKLDPVQALDILCRPWALEPHTGISIRLPAKLGGDNSEQQDRKRKRPTPEGTKQYMKRRCIVKVEELEEGRKWTYVKKDSDELIPDDRSMVVYINEIQLTEEWVDQGRYKWKRRTDWDEIKQKYFPKKPAGQGGSSGGAENHSDRQSDAVDPTAEKDVPLPSWVAKASQAPFRFYHDPKVGIEKTGRANADPLVGAPQDGHRNYSAAQTKAVNLDALRFSKRPKMGHYSLYVTGFEFDEVTEVENASQVGNIPQSWLDLGLWRDPDKTDPPDEFWRTIVADRGPDNRNPPYYYARACKEAVHKGGIGSGTVDTMALVNSERNSIVAEFCRRVHSVIWNRSLFRTFHGKLGLASSKVQKRDKVCIFYGCTVPVILKQHKKEDRATEEELFEDRVEALKRCIRRLVRTRERNARHMLKMETHPNPHELMKDTNEVNKTLKQNKADRDAEKAKRDAKAKRAREKRNLDQKNADRSRENVEKAKKEDSEVWYEFKGECYVHKMMDGEAMRERFYNDLRDRLFELR